MKSIAPLEGPKRKDGFVNQPFLPNGSGFIHKDVFVKLKNLIYPQKYIKSVI